MIRTAAFQPAWWLRNRHAQTLWASVIRRGPDIRLRRERLELPDGDFLDLDWAGEQGPIVLVLHGLEGSSRSRYARGLLCAIRARGWRGVLMHFRGCSGMPNRLDRGYHSGETGDLAAVVATLRAREPDTPICAVGYSLGGNVLLKWLGESGAANPLAAAVAVSVPFQLDDAARTLEHGFARVYQWSLLRRMRRSLRRKFRRRASPIELEGLRALRTFRAFDDYVTAPLHGFAGVDDYYQRSSSRQYLGGIAIPTLILHARDDAFMTRAAIPQAQELSASVTLELSSYGGHVGFVSGACPWRPSYWLEQRIPAHLARILGKQPG